jgi:hypothetical protein
MKIRKTVGGVALALGLLGTATLEHRGAIRDRNQGGPSGGSRGSGSRAVGPGYIYERGHYVWDGNRYRLAGRQAS